jgi:hypothetical protein
MYRDRLSKVCASLKTPQAFSNANMLNILFHYTNNENKEKIVVKDKVVFKLSRVDQFLDKNEGYQILEPYYHACGYLYESGIIEKDFFLILKNIKAKDLQTKFANAWVVCFSKNRNSEFMKRRYASGDGWILGISFDRLHTIDTGIFDCIDHLTSNDINLDSHEFNGDFSLYEVEYSFDKMFRFITESLHKYYVIYKSKRRYDGETKEEIVADIVNWLEDFCLRYKSNLYEQEEEIRLICKPESGFSSWEDSDYGIQIKSSIAGHDAVIEMILDKKWLVYKSQQLNNYFDTKSNKIIPTN